MDFPKPYIALTALFLFTRDDLWCDVRNIFLVFSFFFSLDGTCGPFRPAMGILFLKSTMTGRLRFIFPFAPFLALSYYFTAWSKFMILLNSLHNHKNHTFLVWKKKCSCLLGEFFTINGEIFYCKIVTTKSPCAFVFVLSNFRFAQNPFVWHAELNQSTLRFDSQ